MNGRATITVEVTPWDESTYEALEETGKLTRAPVPQVFSGDLESDDVMEFVMCYPPDGAGTASFIGQQRVAPAGGAGDASPPETVTWPVAP
jgi:hypothetical protein